MNNSINQSNLAIGIKLLMAQNDLIKKFQLQYNKIKDFYCLETIKNLNFSNKFFLFAGNLQNVEG